MSVMSVLITAFGFIGVVLSVFLVFFEVKRRIISVKNMIFAIFWLILFILGVVNLYYMHHTYNEIIASQQNSNDNTNETDNQNNSIENEQNNEAETEYKNSDSQTDNQENSNFSEEELLIAENSDLIQELKNSNADTIIIQSSSVTFWFHELAGYIYSDIRKAGKPYMLNGRNVIPSKVIILDYLSDEIIYTFNPKENSYIEYFPDNQDMFYGIVFHEDYNFYVTQPIQVVGGDDYNGIDILLNKDSDEFTPLFQLRTYVKDLQADEDYSLCSSDYRVVINCKNMYFNEAGGGYQTTIVDSGIMSFGLCSYFSLNTNYIMNLNLYKESDTGSILSSETFYGITADSNVVDIFFDINDESDSL